MITKEELSKKISEIYKLINYQNVEFEWNDNLIKARKICNEIQSKLHQPTVMVRSEQLPCSHCGRPLKEHSKDSKLCPDRMKNFEQGN
jgi:DNA repair ATPase RecN